MIFRHEAKDLVGVVHGDDSCGCDGVIGHGLLAGEHKTPKYLLRKPENSVQQSLD